MNDEAKLEIWKRKLVEIDNKVKKLDNHRNILINLLNEARTRRNIKLNSSLKGLNLEEEVLHLKDWIRFHERESSIYKNKINALQELSQQAILEQELEDLEKDVEKEEIKEDVKEEPVLDLKELEEEKVESEEPDLVVGSQSTKEDEKELTAITRLFDETPEIKAVRAQIKELFKDKKDIIRPSRFKENLISFRKSTVNVFESVKTSVNNRFESLKSIDKKYVVYTVPVILLLLFTGILFISKPEITGYVAITQEKTYTDNLDLVVNESGNYTWTIDGEGDIQSIKASGKVKGNGTVRVYIEKDGIRYLIFDNNKSK